jgi:uncharacterized hydrophobic protein (TIGR00271 family)
MARNPKGSFSAGKWRQLIGDWASGAGDAVPTSDLAQQMGQASIFAFSFFFMLALATAIATFGLIANSAPAIIGAMIIAPLMNPIISLSYALVAFDTRLIIRSILTVTGGVILVVVLAYLITLVFGLRITGSEILNRTSPTVIDLGVAMAAGGAAAYANTRRSIISSIAGVAIAVALVPPLAVSGIGLALGRRATAETGLSLSEFGLYSGGTDIAQGAFLLFLTNFIGIVAVAILVFVCRYGQWKKALLALLLFFGLSAILIQPLGTALHRLYVENRVVRLIAKLPHVRPDIVSGRTKFDSINVNYRDGVLHVSIDGFMPRDLLKDKPGATDIQERVNLFQEYLSDDIGEPVWVEFDVIPVDMTEIKGKRPAPQGAEQQADR